MAIVDRLIANPDTRHYIGKTQWGFDRIQASMRTRLIEQEDPEKVLLTTPEQSFLDILAAEAQIYNTEHGQSSIGLGIVIVGSMARAALDESVVAPGDVDVRITSDLDLHDAQARAYWRKLNSHIGHILTYHAMNDDGLITGISQPMPSRYFASLPLREPARHDRTEQVRFKVALVPDDYRPDVQPRNVDLLLSNEPDLLTTTELLQKESWKSAYPHCVLITE